jgi:glycosyltransferase involved in cell wall biosynthesis
LAAWINEPDQGQSEAINKGFRLAHGEILAWLNSDDLYYPQTVTEAVDMLLSTPQIGMVYGDTDLIEHSGGLSFGIKSDHWIPHSTLRWIMIYGSGFPKWQRYGTYPTCGQVSGSTVPEKPRSRTIGVGQR